MRRALLALALAGCAVAQFQPPAGGGGPTYTFNAPISAPGNVIQCAVATGSIPGCLSAADWTTFNGKQDALGFTPITNALTSGKINVGNGSNVAAPVTPSADVTMTNAGAFTVARVNGNTPGGTCTGGQFVDSLSTSAVPVCATPTIGGSGGGTSGWSGLPLTFVSNTTQYAAPVGGALTSTTESVVQLKAPVASTISGLQVTLGASLGTGTTLAVTLRDGGVSQSLTCTTASGGTTCTDTTHTVNVALGDNLSFLLVATGTVTSGLPQVEIGYASETSGTSVAALPPYEQIGSTLYIPADNMSQATLPSLGSYTALSGLTAPAVTTQTNGNVTIGTGAQGWLADPSHIISIESVFRCYQAVNNSSFVNGLFVWDSTNSKIYELVCSGGASPSAYISLSVFILTYSGSGTPTFSSNPLNVQYQGATVHAKESISGTTLSYGVSFDGGISFVSMGTQTVGTISKIGYALSNTSNTGSLNVFSAVVN